MNSSYMIIQLLGTIKYLTTLILRTRKFLSVYLDMDLQIAFGGKGFATIFLAGTSGTPGGDGEVRIHIGLSISPRLAPAGALYV